MSFFNNILSLNNFLFFVLLIAVFLISFKYGKKLCLTLILATYPTILIFNNLTFLKTENATTSIVLLGIVYLLLLAILWVNLHPHNPYNRIRKIFDYAVLSLSFIILLVGVAGNSLTIIDSFLNLGGIAIWLNKNISYGFILLIPIIAMLITNKNKS